MIDLIISIISNNVFQVGIASLVVWAVKTYVPQASPVLLQAMKLIDKINLPNAELRDHAIEHGLTKIAKKIEKDLITTGNYWV